MAYRWRTRAFSDKRRVVEETQPAMRGALLEKVHLNELGDPDTQPFEPKITQVELVASFNWLQVGSGQIITPGMPPKWTPLPRPRKLKQDEGDYYRDINDASYPSHPTEPAVEVIMKMDSRPKVTIDLFACAATLGQLFRFIQGNQPSFRILVDRIGNTVHFTRRNKSPRETIPDIKGYGHTFPESYTTWDASVPGSSSHQRVIQYLIGRLTCQVRFEGDGYMADKIDSSTSVKRHVHETAAHSRKQDSGVLGDLLHSLAVSESSLSASDAPLEISTAGSKVPQDALFDLKTRSIMRKPDQEAIIQQELHRLWIRQVPTLILAYHRYGTFDDIQILDMRGRVAEWERMNKANVARFEKLLQQILSIVRGREDGRLEMICEEGDTFLQIRRQAFDVGATLSASTEQRWEDWLDQDEEE